MRVKRTNLELDNDRIKDFFRGRAGKYNEENPYAVTMYQDDHPELVRQRDECEKEKLLPKLDLNGESNVLDLACGIGRWADAVATKVDSYLGIDFSEDLIGIADKRPHGENVRFRVGAAAELDSVLAPGERFNRVLIVGLFVYLNDASVLACTQALERHCEDHTIVCIREPMGIAERLTVKDHFSSELKDTYNAIYRTRDEVVAILAQTMLSKGFKIVDEGFLFEDKALNNRKETAQYYLVLRR